MLCVARNDAERNNIVFKGLDVVRQYAALLERRVQRGTRARKALVVTRQTNPLGRSMIEMLGVLAIIGVLSVGGIAGYSKAMEKWKENKIIGEYSYLIQGIIEHLSDFEKLNSRYTRYDLLPTLSAMNLLPGSWKNANNYDGHKNVYDTLGNNLSVFSRANKVVMTILFGESSVSENGNTTSHTFSKKLCKAFWQNLLVPLHEHIYFAGVYCSNIDSLPNYYFNDKYCGEELNHQCISAITLSDIERICSSTADDEAYCALTWEFDY